MGSLASLPKPLLGSSSRSDKSESEAIAGTGVLARGVGSRGVFARGVGSLRFVASTFLVAERVAFDVDGRPVASGDRPVGGLIFSARFIRRVIGGGGGSGWTSNPIRGVMRGRCRRNIRLRVMLVVSYMSRLI